MPHRKSAWEKAKKYGIDVSLLELNLTKTPTDRAIALQEVVNFMDNLKTSGKKYYAKLLHRDSKKPLSETANDLAKFKNLYLITNLGSIDFIGHVAGIGSYNDLKTHTIEIELFGKRCRVLDIDSLIKSKKEMNRPKDKEVILQLEAIKEKLGE